ncbi:DUF6653 family protein [Pseudovibrio sp. Tun.PSC04-5.I4]|uniref:DUF6653 family protein n=1 Tax=Pseudovibrio sp. Tun.PSC04-5.I4 TaxID=1798213 RepID=UPI0008870A12|nr:DUF6653 family protein [Pseudovibrio sp. Tun.PSC04-5.I4]SDR11987.1 hypothetical protein SAMN04515695_2869 [Pseudovibrio sp. Tun.PSC04-5.I4]
MSGDLKLSQKQPRKVGGLDPRHLRHLNTQSAALMRISKPKNTLIRALALPALLAPLWFQISLGWFWAIGLSVAAIFWIWAIPGFKSKPSDASSWPRKAALGERMWLNRIFVPIPHQLHHKALALLLVGLAFVGVSIWGAVSNDLPILMTGIMLTYMAKLISMFVMVKVYEHMKNAHPLYKSWRTVPSNDNRLKAQTG